MLTVVYKSIVIIYQCWSLVNCVLPDSKQSVSPFAAGPSNVLTTPGPTGYRSLAVNNEKFDEADESMIFTYDDDVSTVKIESFYNAVYNTLEEHLFECLLIDNTDALDVLSQFLDFIMIKQNLLNNSIGLLRQSRHNTTQLMRLYLFFCGPFPESYNLNDLKYGEYSQRIRYIQQDIKEKFKKIIGDKIFLGNFHVGESKKWKEKTESKLLSLATRAIYKIRPNMLPGNPLHFVCIDLLKWTALMESDNEDAVKIQQMRITVENRDITMQEFAKRYRCEIDVGNLNRLNYEVLLRINNMLLYYLYKHFYLSSILIKTNISKFNPNNMVAISSATAQIEVIRPFLEIFDIFFVTRYLFYVDRPTAQTKLTALITYMDRFYANLEDTVQEMERSPEKTANDINQLITEFVMAFLLDLNVVDHQKWIDGVKEEVEGTLDNINLALELNSNKALSIMALCVKQLNPDWPNIRYRDPTEFLTATQLAHKVVYAEEYDSDDNNTYNDINYLVNS